MRRLIAALLLAILASVAAPAQAAISLATDPTAFIDGGGYQWHGSTPFDNGFGLSGYVEWAVYGPGAFPGAFTGYTPTSGELTYAYQLFVTGTLPLSSFAVAIAGPADNIGTFSGGGVAGAVPTSSTFGGSPPDSADWEFKGIGFMIPGGSSSQGLAFSSPNGPMAHYGSAIDGGTFAFVDPLPSPVPEASSLVLWLGLGAVGAVIARRHRFGRATG